MRSQTDWVAVCAVVVAVIVLALAFSRRAKQPLATAPQRALFAVGCAGLLIGAIAIVSTWGNAKYALNEVLTFSICGNCTHTTGAYFAAVGLWIGAPSITLAYLYNYTVTPFLDWVRTGER